MNWFFSQKRLRFFGRLAIIDFFSDALSIEVLGGQWAAFVFVNEGVMGTSAGMLGAKSLDFPNKKRNNCRKPISFVTCVDERSSLLRPFIQLELRWLLFGIWLVVDGIRWLLPWYSLAALLEADADWLTNIHLVLSHLIVYRRLPQGRFCCLLDHASR